MSRSAETGPAPGGAAALVADARREAVKRAIDHAAHLLPAQGPIGVFIHHNTLHAFQHLPFEEAVVKAAGIFGTEPYMPEAKYQAERRRGRIRDEDVDWVLAREEDAEILPGALTRRQLRRAMLIPGVRHFSPATIEWQIDECGLLERLRDDLPQGARRGVLEADPGRSEAAATHALFTVCFHRIPVAPPAAPAPPARPRDGVLARTGTDTDDAIHPWLIRLCAVFTDQGISYWPMPEREQGFYLAVRELFRQPAMVEPPALAGTRRAFEAQAAAGMDAEGVILAFLERFSPAEAEWEHLLEGELLALPGWAGLIRRLEEEPELAPYERVPSALADFLAVRLTLTEVAAENAWRRAGEAGDVAAAWHLLPPTPEPQQDHVRDDERMAAAARLFDAAQLLGLSAARLEQMEAAAFARLVVEVERFDEFERRRVLHLAYERRHEKLILHPMQLHRRTVDPRARRGRSKAQVMFCIDEREESTRRALEEIDPEIETESAAGFYGVAVNYRGLDDPHGVSLCPIVVTPQHAVVEKPKSEEDAALQAQRQARRRLWGDLCRGSVIGSRTLVRGWLGSMGLGLISLAPLITRVLSPRTAARLYAWFSDRLLPEPRTELTLMRQDAAGHEATEGLLLGFTIEEKADRVASVLAPAGMTRDLARIVVVLGHGSTSLNNPHESAHDCGACGGRRGGPNARLFAAMANHPEVRARLRDRGIVIPEDTWFVGGYHDTCNDEMPLFDTDLIPESHLAEFEAIRATLDRARAAEALERSRRFEAAWRDETPEQALMHVQERAEHLAEPRPEYGHCTNAVAVIGRRAITRGLYMDRRAFLISYDPDGDPEDKLLTALLSAGGPVCAGISLEYYFSFVDNEGYGCGTKLPHNVTGLMGVMNGHASDLRTGLPWQMVEIHEPVRLLLIVETTPERLVNATSRLPGVIELVEKRWMRVVTIDPDDGTVHVYRDGVFERFEEPTEPLPVAPSSAAWFRGKMEHLPLARIDREAAGVC